MANTYTLISSNVLTSSAASVTFSAIPSTYTDLVLRVSARGQENATVSVIDMKINNDSSALYSETDLYGDGSTASSFRASSVTKTQLIYMDGNTATANTFASVEIYIPSYTASQNKPFSVNDAVENNTTTAYIIAGANLYRSTTAISSVTFTGNTGAFSTGSSFYLYGIKNS